VVLERKGEKHYFCSRECRDSFRQHQGEHK
jgi:YHS domain-containing protein